MSWQCLDYGPEDAVIVIVDLYVPTTELAGICRFRLTVCVNVPIPLLGLAASTLTGLFRGPDVIGRVSPVPDGVVLLITERFDEEKSVPRAVPTYLNGDATMLILHPEHPVACTV
jgi:hypothetical protein